MVAKPEQQPTVRKPKNLDLKKMREVGKRVIKEITAWLKEMAKR
jgi:hypothetical protein